MDGFVYRLNTFGGTFTTCFIVGIIFFLLFYGWQVVLPHNVSWLLNGQDLEQHYFGWAFYRNSPWVFPIGEITALAYPYGVPITFTDSIPLIAIPLKLLSSVLPQDFQYFGIWGLFSFGLTAGFAGIIARRFNANIMMSCAIALLTVTTPVLIARMFVHTALASVWLIIAAFAFLAYWRSLVRRGLLFQLIMWSSLYVLAILVHPYYMPMVGSILIVYVIVSHRRYLDSFLKVAVPLLAAVSVFWLIGGFSLQGDGSLGTPNEYNLDIAAPLSGARWSNLVPTLGGVSGESMMFVGLGVLFAVATSIVVFVFKHDSNKLWKVTREAPFKSFGILIIVAAVTAMTAWTVIRANGHELLSLEWLPMRLQSLWGTFRASARLFWPIYYLIVLLPTCYLIYSLRYKLALLYPLVALIVLLQLVDVTTSRAAANAREVTP